MKIIDARIADLNDKLRIALDTKKALEIGLSETKHKIIALEAAIGELEYLSKAIAENEKPTT